MSDIKPLFGELLQELRKDKGLTQRQLAKELNIAASSIGGYEAENITPSFDVLIEMAKFFNVSTDYLLGLVRVRTSWKNILCGVHADAQTTVSIEKLLDAITKLNEKDQEILVQVLLALSAREKYENSLS